MNKIRDGQELRFLAVFDKRSDNMKRKILCLVTAAVMAASIPVTALAEDNENVFIVDEETGEVSVEQGEIVETPEDDTSDTSSTSNDDDEEDDRTTHTSGSQSNIDDEDGEDETTASESVDPFNDVTETDWFYEYVVDAYDKGLMAGTGDNEFSPNATLTRGMVTSIVYRMAGSPDVVYTAKFTDVPDGQWYTDGMLWASDNGVIAGYGDGLCGPNDPITVEQMASILYRYAGSPDMTANASVLDSYPDAAEVSAYATDAMKWAVVNGMTQGTTLHPTTNATRAEAAKMFSLF